MDIFITRHSVKYFFYLLLVISIAFLINDYWPRPEDHWLIWTVAMTSLVLNGITFRQRLFSIAKMGLSLCAIVYFMGTIGQIKWAILIWCPLFAMVGAYLWQRYPTQFWSIFAVVLSGLIAGLLPTTGLLNFMRIKAILCGVGIVLIAQFIFYPYFIRNELRSQMIHSLWYLMKLNDCIFMCLTDPEYADNVYLYERRLHERKNQWMGVIKQIRESFEVLGRSMNEEERLGYAQMMRLLEDLYENMLDYAQIRRRVTDYTSFSVCAPELHDIAAEIKRLFTSMMLLFSKRRLYLNESTLEEKIKRLEDSYYHVLQVATREPLVFLLFIDSLYAFSNIIRQVNEWVAPKQSGYA